MEIKLELNNSIYTTAEYHKDRPRAMHLEQEGGHRQRLLMAGFIAGELAAKHNCKTLVDIGCGDGGLLQLIKLFYKSVWGYDFQPKNVFGGITDRGVSITFCNIINNFQEMHLDADVGVLTEVLEHMDNPHLYLEKLHTKTKIKYLILSSPRIETLEKHYEGHIWAWDLDGYRELIIKNGWNILEHHIMDDFQIVLAERE